MAKLIEINMTKTFTKIKFAHKERDITTEKKVLEPIQKWHYTSIISNMA